MKILIVSQYFWPENFRINNVAKALQAAGCEVVILTGQPNYPDGKIFPGYRAWRTSIETYSGCQVVRVPLFPRGRGGAYRLGANYLSFISTSILIGCWRLRRKKFDIVFVYGTSPIFQSLTGTFFSALKRVPLILWVQDLWPESLSATGYVRNPFALNLVAQVVGWLYRKCDLILIQSRGFLSSVKTLCGSTPVVYYPNPGDIDRDSKAVDPIHLPEGFNITFGGNLGVAQSVETILDAAERLLNIPELNIVILGSGSRLSWMTREVERRSLSNVHLLGRFEPGAVADAMIRSDALLVSLKNDEGLNKTIPSKLSTYLGAGRPIIACLNGDAANLVKAAGAGLVCEAENADQLAAAVLDLKSKSIPERDAMGAAGRRWYNEHLELNSLIEVLIEHFNIKIDDYKASQLNPAEASSNE